MQELRRLTAELPQKRSHRKLSQRSRQSTMSGINKIKKCINSKLCTPPGHLRNPGKHNQVFPSKQSLLAQIRVSEDRIRTQVALFMPFLPRMQTFTGDVGLCKMDRFKLLHHKFLIRTLNLRTWEAPPRFSLASTWYRRLLLLSLANSTSLKAHLPFRIVSFLFPQKVLFSLVGSPKADLVYKF